MELVKQKIFKAITSLVNDQSIVIVDDTSLIGDGSILNSMKLVELCLLLEDMAEADFDFKFDWTSEVAMSKSRSIFRNANALVSEFLVQMEQNK